jgi:hypothetical protein
MAQVAEWLLRGPEFNSCYHSCGHHCSHTCAVPSFTAGLCDQQTMTRTMIFLASVLDAVSHLWDYSLWEKLCCKQPCRNDTQEADSRWDYASEAGSRFPSSSWGWAACSFWGTLSQKHPAVPLPNSKHSEIGQDNECVLF